jgi:hypothetical protein
MGDEITYGIAQICMNGHVINHSTDDQKLQQKFCEICGEEVINKCLVCEESVKGKARIEDLIDPPYLYTTSKYIRPAFCINCGNPFPWTQRAKESAFELIDMADNLNQTEKDEWKLSVPALIMNSPKANVAVVKFNSFTNKAGNVVGKAVKDIIIGVVSETIKNLILKG